MYLEIRYFYFIWKSDKTVCSRRGQFPLRGKGKESLAQSPLPLRPPPETWGTPPYTVTAIRFLALMGRQSCRFLESTSLYPPPAALSPLSPIPPRGTKGRDCGPSPLETPLRIRGAAAGRGAEGVLFATQRMPCPQMRGRTQVIWVLSAQPAEGFRILAAVRTDCSFVWVSWPLRRSTHP